VGAISFSVADVRGHAARRQVRRLATTGRDAVLECLRIIDRVAGHRQDDVARGDALRVQRVACDLVDQTPIGRVMPSEAAISA
jgi:hypothetical protein